MPTAQYCKIWARFGEGRQVFAAQQKCPWVRIASSVLSASIQFPFSRHLAESTLEAMRTQGARILLPTFKVRTRLGSFFNYW
jgi:hypothetical protein